MRCFRGISVVKRQDWLEEAIRVRATEHKTDRWKIMHDAANPRTRLENDLEKHSFLGFEKNLKISKVQNLVFFGFIFFW